MIRFAAPGRVNLIGEHTDYNLGFALPIALPGPTVATFAPGDADAITVRSDREPGAARIPLDTAAGEITGWAAYVAGVVWALRRAGHPVIGGDMCITGGPAAGAGLASSAALECAVLGAILHATGVAMDRIEQARLAQAAENEYVGAPTGLLDQLCALFGQPSSAMLVDFLAVSVCPVAFDPESCDVALLVVDSRARHQHAGGAYAQRRASCERAAADLGASSLRDVQDSAPWPLAAIRDPVDRRRARHVPSENRRVLDFVAALDDCDFGHAGRLLTASHASMRDDFEITTAHIDLIADTAVWAGALGARMTGGGFGGCVIALAPAGAVDAIGAAVRDAVGSAGHPTPAIARIRAGAGAALLG